MTAEGAYDGARRVEGQAAANAARRLVLLAVANFLGMALLFVATAKGHHVVSRYSYDHGCQRVSPQLIPVDPLPRTTTCGKPFAQPFWGLATAPILAAVVTGFIWRVLSHRGQRKAAAIQSVFFVVALGAVVFGGTRLLEYWT